MALWKCDLKSHVFLFRRVRPPDETDCVTNRSLPGRAELVTAPCEEALGGGAFAMISKSSILAQGSYLQTCSLISAGINSDKTPI